MGNNIKHQELKQENVEKKIQLSYDTHSFDPLLASQIGVLEAIMVKHFIFWITLIY